jgi:hypothetical protein
VPSDPFHSLNLRNGFGPSATVRSVVMYQHDRVSIKRYNQHLIDYPISSRREVYFEETR